MKKSLGVFVFWLIFLPLAVAHAFDPAQICLGVSPVQILTDRVIQTALTNYKNYSCLGNSAYCLCFQYPGVEIDTSRLSNLSLDSSAGGKPVYIVGLKLKGPLNHLSLTGTQPIILLNSTFNQCTDCLSVNGDGFQLENVTINCGDPGSDKININSVVGIQLSGDGHSILNSKIKQCKIGLQIGDATHAGNNNHIGPGDTVDVNGIGFKVVNGQGNYFQQDSVFENDENGDLTYSGNEGIRLEPETNGNAPMPLVLNVDGNVITPDKLENAVICEKTNDGATTSKIKFKISYPRGVSINAIKGKAEISLTNNDYDDKFKQGKIFSSEVNCDLIDKRKIGEFEATCTFDHAITESDPDAKQPAVLLFHHPQFGSTTYSLRFVLKPCEWLLPGAEFDAPGAQSGVQVATAGGVSDAGGGAPISSTPAAPTDDKKKESDQGIGATTPSGESTAGVIPTGIGATGASGGIGIKAAGCGASLNPDPSTTPFPVLLTVLFAFFTLIGIRKKIP